MKTDVKEIDKKIAKLFEALEVEINKRSELTSENHMNYLGSMTEHILWAINQFEKFKAR